MKLFTYLPYQINKYLLDTLYVPIQVLGTKGQSKDNYIFPKKDIKKAFSLSFVIIKINFL